MKFIRYLTYLLYSYYSTGSRASVAYVSAVSSLTLLIGLNLLNLAMIFHLDRYIPLTMGESKDLRYFKLILLLAPVFLLIYFGVGEKRLINMKEDFGYAHWDKEYNHRVWLWIGFAITFVVLVILSFLKSKATPGN